MTAPLPTFRYHPDPIGTGSVVTSDARCLVCEASRGYIYTGPFFAEEEVEEELCPWCIASGDAAARFDGIFVDDWGLTDNIPDSVVAEITQRTPGFSGWQQERWWLHCGDGGTFLGPAGAADVVAHGPITREHLRQDLGWPADERFDRYIASLTADGQPTAYLFKCRVCGEVGGYSDFA
ncbi:MAG: CbrC family protein [Deltaproteobacteria bacterium]|nr:CbrC family protein [Deltaproteobacteria bacterium]